MGIFGKGKTKKQDDDGAETPQEASAAAPAPAPVEPAAPTSNFATFASMEDYVATLPGPSMTDVSKQGAEASAAA